MATEYRIKGELGDGVTVYTEWMDMPEAKMMGIEIGCDTVYGWRDTEIEERQVNE